LRGSGLNNQSLPALAARIAEMFPSLEGRCVAVADMDELLNKENMPTLPMCAVGLISLDCTGGTKNNSPLEITEHILVEFYLKPERIMKRGADGKPAGVTNFWAYYDYVAILNTMLNLTTSGFRLPTGSKLVFKRLHDIKCNAFSVCLPFVFEHTYVWCADYVDNIPERRIGATATETQALV
jgi:hypothetical protein